MEPQTRILVAAILALALFASPGCATRFDAGPIDLTYAIGDGGAGEDCNTESGETKCETGAMSDGFSPDFIEGMVAMGTRALDIMAGILTPFVPPVVGQPLGLAGSQPDHTHEE